MPRKKIYNDEQRRIKKIESNNKPENKEKRRLNSLKYYEKIKLRNYMMSNNGSSEGFIFKHIQPPTQIFITPISVDGVDLLEESDEVSSVHAVQIEYVSEDLNNLIYSDDSD
jgi:hypothetical protein